MNKRYLGILSLSWQNPRQTVGLLVFSLLIAFGVAIAPATSAPAYAGSNGQQIMIQVNMGGFSAFRHFHNLEIHGTGYNNNPNQVYWSGSNQLTQNPFRLYNWWWKGNAAAWGSIRLANGANTYFNCSFNVPVSQDSNWTKLTLTARTGSAGGISYSCSVSKG